MRASLWRSVAGVIVASPATHSTLASVATTTVAGLAASVLLHRMKVSSNPRSPRLSSRWLIPKTVLWTYFLLLLHVHVDVISYMYRSKNFILTQGFSLHHIAEPQTIGGVIYKISV